jgi:aspartate kinase
MNQEVGFGHRALGVLLAHDISFEHIPSAIDSMSIIVSDDELRGREARVMDELRAVLGASRVETQADLAIIATVGEGMAYRVGVAGRVFSALAEAGVNVRMISQGASEISILIGVAAPDYERAVCALYTAFVP